MDLAEALERIKTLEAERREVIDELQSQMSCRHGRSIASPCMACDAVEPRDHALNASEVYLAFLAGGGAAKPEEARRVLSFLRDCRKAESSYDLEDMENPLDDIEGAYEAYAAYRKSSK